MIECVLTCGLLLESQAQYKYHLVHRILHKPKQNWFLRVCKGIHSTKDRWQISCSPTDFQNCQCNVVLSGYSLAFRLFKWQMQAVVTCYPITRLHMQTSNKVYGTHMFYYSFYFELSVGNLSLDVYQLIFAHVVTTHAIICMHKHPNCKLHWELNPKNCKSGSSEKWSHFEQQNCYDVGNGNRTFFWASIHLCSTSHGDSETL